jgi:hypothetical protein
MYQPLSASMAKEHQDELDRRFERAALARRTAIPTDPTAWRARALGHVAARLRAIADRIDRVSREARPATLGRS